MAVNWKILAVAVGAVVMPLAAVPSTASAQAAKVKAGKSVDTSYGRASKGGKGGPAFCRSGAGHPVHGRAWCLEKGFTIGGVEWGRARWGDILIGRSRESTRAVNSGSLADILGRVVFGRLQSQAKALGGGSLNGNWVDTNDGPLILQVQTGGLPLAEFVDRNRDGRAEVVLLNLGR